MFLNLKTSKSIPLALRLTLWYAGIFTISSFLAFTIFYYAIASILYQRTDDELVEDVIELFELLQDEERAELKDEFDTEIEAEGADKVFYRLLSKDNLILLETDLSNWPNLIALVNLRKQPTHGQPPLLYTLYIEGQDNPVRIISAVDATGRIMQIGQSFEDDNEFLQAFRNIFMVAVPLIMIIAGFFGWFMARKALQGVREVTAAAIGITKGDLNRRVPQTGRGDDIDQLANTFNIMLDRIQALITGMQEMTDNIAHDLRSPLARIRGIAETTLLNNPSIDDFKSVAGSTIEECDRLLHMINTMLDITETEAGTIKRIMEPVDMVEIIKNACDLFQPLAEDKQINLKCNFIEHARVQGSVQHLQRLIGNLLDNAMKYTSSGGSVTLDLFQNNSDFVVEVCDSGIGIAEADIKNVFKRFYRCDQSRSQSGIGLGLCLALAITRAHSGDIMVSSELNKGSKFKFTIPALL